MNPESFWRSDTLIGIVILATLLASTTEVPLTLTSITLSTDDCPFKLWKAKSKFGLASVPVFVTVTEGVPTLASTLAVASTEGVVPESP